jgi:hypothetical protein
MIYRYVNLSVFNSSNEGYSINSQMGFYNLWDYFRRGSVLSDDLTVYLSGSRNTWDLCYWDQGNFELPIVFQTVGSTPRTIYLKSYDDTPWVIDMVGNMEVQGDVVNPHVQFLVNFVGYNTGVNKVVFENGMIESSNAEIGFINQQNSANIQLNSILLKSPSIIYPGFVDIDVRGCSLISDYSKFNSNQNVNIVNSILGITQIDGDVPQNFIKHINLNHVVFSNYISSYNTINNFNFDVYQDGWEIPSIWQENISAYTTENLSYLTSGFSNITVSGSKSLADRPETPWDGRRDGIGFLYFDHMLVDVVKPFETSGYAPWECSLNFENQLVSASKLVVNWGDGTGLFTYTTGTSATHVYNNIGEYVISVRNYSKNNWYNKYDYCVEDLTVNAIYNDTISAGLIILDPDNNIVTDNLVENKIYTFSATEIFGDVVNYVFELERYSYENGYEIYYTTSASNLSGISEISEQYFHDIYSINEHRAYLHLNVGMDNYFLTSATYSMAYATSTDYYVDLARTDNNGQGTSNSPLSFYQMADMVKYQGVANRGDAFYIRNNINLIRPFTGTRPYEFIKVDSRKGFYFRAWSLENYGPWMLAIFDDDTLYNGIVDFEGSSIYDCIIYNRPYTYNTFYYGGELTLSNVNNSWIVNQGMYSKIVIKSNNINVAGSTIYSENAIDVNVSDLAYVTLTDSVFNDCNFITSAQNVSFISHNNCYGGTSACLSAFDLTLDEDQFGWEIPDDWPMTVGNRNYEKGINTILQNKTDFAVFPNIEEPPQPGQGIVNSYINYPNGLFGNSRILYYRE